MTSLATAQKTTLASTQNNDTRPVRVVWMDDDADVIARAESSFASEGQNFELHTFQSPTMGLSMFADLSPDIFVLDIAMPLMDGGSVLSVIRSRAGFANTPVIFQTSLIGPDEVGEAGYLISGGEIMMPKPVNMETLKRLIGELLK